MNDSEYKEILDFLREKVRESIYRDIDDVASVETSNIQSQKARLDMYLRILIGMSRERSNSRALIINERISRNLNIESGGKFDGIEIQLSPTESESFGISQFTLNDLDEVGPFINQLEDILKNIHDDPEPSDSGPRKGPKP